MIKQYEATVVEEFQCILSKQFYPIGSKYVSDEERVKYLNEAGYVEGVTEVAPLSIPGEPKGADPEDPDNKGVGDNTKPEQRKGSTKDKS